MSPNNKGKNKRSNSNNNNTKGHTEPYRTRSVKAITKTKKDTVISDAYDSYNPPKNLRPEQKEPELEEVIMEDEDTAEFSSKNTEETAQGSPQQGAADNDRPDEPINDETSKSSDDDDHDFQKVDRNRGYRAGAPADKIKGKSHPEKLQTVAKHFLKCRGYAGKQILTIKSVRYAVVYFDTADDLAEAIKSELSISETEKISFVPYDDIMKRPLPDAVEQENKKTIQVIDIP